MISNDTTNTSDLQPADSSQIKEFNTAEFAAELKARGFEVSTRTLEGWRISRNGRPAKLPATRKNDKGQAIYTLSQLEEVLNWKNKGLEDAPAPDNDGEEVPATLDNEETPADVDSENSTARTVVDAEESSNSGEQFAPSVGNEDTLKQSLEEPSADEEAREEHLLNPAIDTACAVAQIDSGKADSVPDLNSSKEPAPQNSEITLGQPSVDSDSDTRDDIEIAAPAENSAESITETDSDTAAPMDASLEENSETAQVQTSPLNIPAVGNKDFEDWVFEPLGGKTTEMLVVETRYFLKNTVQSIIGAGRRLIECKKRVPYGAWRQWVKDNIAVEYRTVANYMAIAEKFDGGENAKTFAQLSYSKCVALLPLNSDERTQLVEEQETKGKPIDKQSVRELKKTVAEFKQREAAPAPDDEIPQAELPGKYIDVLDKGIKLPPDVPSAATVQPTPEPPQSESQSADKKPLVTLNTGCEEWYTPEQYIEAARKILEQIDLDPATSEIAQQTVRAEKYFTVEEDGLSQEWSGNIWLNPPYSRGLLDKFVGKLLVSTFKAAIVLTDSSTETGWFSRLAARAQVICFSNKRIKFLRPDGSEGNGSPTRGSAFFYFGNEADKFREVFQQFGWFAKFIPVATQGEA